MKYKILIILSFSKIFSQVEVVILSDKVGTEIDIHENRFYRIFTDTDNFLNAQVLRLKLSPKGYLSADEKKYRVKITTKNSAGKKNIIKKVISQSDFNKLKLHVDGQPVFTEKKKIEMYEGMDFLRSEKIVAEIPKPQFVKLKHSGKKRLKGTMIDFNEKILYIQTPTTIETVSLSDLDQLSYRDSIGIYSNMRYYTYGITGVLGLLSARRYNSQRSILVNENDIPRKDLSAYSQIVGIVIGLIFSSEIFDALSTLLTPTETLILSESEYEDQNYK
ncbi:MAG: hypothetical protein ACJZ14_04630 [Candidatus Neomarinimicrobiota bacterium]